MANLKRFDSIAIQIRTHEHEVDFVSFTVSDGDVAIQSLRSTFEAMAAKISRQIERRTDLIKGSFISFESVPAPSAGKGSERLDSEHAHCHVLLAVAKGQAEHRRLEVFDEYIVRDLRAGVIPAGRAIATAFYNGKVSVCGSFTKNWKASLEYNFIQRAVQLAGFHRYRCTGIFRDRELPADQQKSLEELEAELQSTTSTHNEQEIPCASRIMPNPPLDNNSPTDSPSSAKLAVTVKVVSRSKSSVIAAGSSKPEGTAFAAAKRVAVGAAGSS